MRIRTVKPEFFTSPDTARASVEARLLYIALWCLADDYGVGEANMNKILGAAFPESDQKTRKEVQSLCKEVSAAYGTVFYSVSGRHYYAIPSWDDHQKTQRRANRRNPGPGHLEAVPDQRFNAFLEPSEGTQGSSERTQGNPPPGKGKGTGEREQGNSSSSAKLPVVAEPPREDVEALCTRLRDHIAGNTAKTPNITAKWRTEARLLLDRDGIPFDEAARVLDWCQLDQFWKSNILSMPKFREKFSALQIKAHQQSNVAQFPGRPTASQRAQAHLDTVDEAVRLMGGGQ